MITFRPAPGLTLFSLVALALLMWLGFWQLDRREWKLNLMDAASTRAEGEALPLTDLLAKGDPEDLRYQKVSFEARKMAGAEVYLFTVGPQGPGYKIILPVDIAGLGPVLVDIGFVPAGQWVPGTSSVEGGKSEILELRGLIRLGSEATIGVGTPDRAARIWTYRDLAGMAQDAGIKPAAPFLVELLPESALKSLSEGGPQPLSPNFEFTNNHLSYALTWFGLAFALISVYIAFHIRQGRLAFNTKEH